MSRDVLFYEHVFPYWRVENTSNEIGIPSILHQSPFTKDQPVSSSPSQVIFAPCDNVHNDHESDIHYPEEICSCRDQNLNENHETTQSI